MFRQLTPLLLLLLLLLLSLAPLDLKAETSVNWKKIADDLELASASFSSGTFTSTEITFVRTALQRYRIRVLRASDIGKKTSNIRSICRQSKGVVCINANFFDEQGEPLGLVVSRGIKYGRIHKGGKTLTGIFEVNKKGVSIVSRRNFDPSNSLEAVQSGPRLIEGGKIVSDLRDTVASSRRSGVCLDKQGRVIFFVVSSRLFGISLPRLQQALIHPAIDCQEALNLDGGGSSQFYLDPSLPGSTGEQDPLYLTGSDRIPVALSLTLRERS